MATIPHVPHPKNEPVQTYAPGTPERASLKATIAAMASSCPEIPLFIGGREVPTGETLPSAMPADHSHVLAQVHLAGPGHVQQAIEAALAARPAWASCPWQDRAAIMLKAADLIATSWRDSLNAATMLGQGKTAHQAEIDAACEMADFLRFNAHFAQQIYAEQPLSAPGTWNQLDHRPLEGFVYAVSPFNFTAIAGNLATAPALMGNTVLWKPSPLAMPSAHCLMQVFTQAGLPPGVINLVQGDAAQITAQALSSHDLAGIHFTGSTAVFHQMAAAVGQGASRYRSLPRLVGETGGKDFIVAHPSADLAALAVAAVRGAFEYQGQKCSAASRIYLPRSLWPGFLERVTAMMDEISVGDPRDFRHFMGPVIGRRAFDRITAAIDAARPTATLLHGGGSDAGVGYFIEPTLVEVDAPDHPLMVEEIFGPVLAAYVYPDGQWHETLKLVDQTSPYALTGAVFATDRAAVREALEALRDAAGNFYINDKPTGAVVGQQPFGGARASGTNDKAGSRANLARWTSPRTIKESFAPDTRFTYPFMEAE